MTSTNLLESAIDYVFSALIFLILIGVSVALYNITFYKEPSVPEQNLGSVYEEFKLLEKDSCFDVVLRYYNKDYEFFLYGYDNLIQDCNKRPCICVHDPEGPISCEIIYSAKRDCKKGICVPKLSSAVIESDETASLRICQNKENQLSIAKV